MPSTPTTRNRLKKQGTGDNTNTWGQEWNTAGLDLIDAALDGVANYTVSGSKTLTSTNYTADEARMRVQNITGGTGGTVTIPGVEKFYLVRNGASGSVTFTTGSGTNAVLPAGSLYLVTCDGVNVRVDTGSEVLAQAIAAADAAQAAADSLDVNLLLSKADNLNSVVDKPTARTNLGLLAMATKAKATAAELSAMSADKGLTADLLSSALAFVTVSYGVTTTVDMAAGNNFRCTLNGNISTLTLSNVIVGKTIEIELVGNSGTARSVVFDANFKGNVPALSDITNTKGYALTIKAMGATQWNAVARQSL